MLVVKRQIRLQSSAGLEIVAESDAVIDLRLHRMKERLDEGIVGHLAGAAAIAPAHDHFGFAGLGASGP